MLDVDELGPAIVRKLNLERPPMIGDRPYLIRSRYCLAYPSKKFWKLSTLSSAMDLSLYLTTLLTNSAYLQVLVSRHGIQIGITRLSYRVMTLMI